jgi:peptidoglycan/xylan/chitin deacetylase (PgdA/CDA1 family)
MSATFSLRVDIDTFHGAKNGIPVLRRSLDRAGVRATFFIVAGRDTSGRHVKRLSQRGYLSRLRAIGLVGVLRRLQLRSMLYGLFLPGPDVLRGNLALARALEADGHEVELHGADHAAWAERVHGWDADTCERYWADAAKAFADAMGRAPRAAAAPNWRADDRALEGIDRLPWAYRTDVRGHGPFFPIVRGPALRTLQIPVSMPAAHEVLVSHGVDVAGVPEVVLASLGGGANVWNIHDWYEGLVAPGVVDRVLEGVRERGLPCLRMDELARRCLEKAEAVPTARVERRAIPGGVGTVSCRVG